MSYTCSGGGFGNETSYAAYAEKSNIAFRKLFNGFAAL